MAMPTMAIVVDTLRSLQLCGVLAGDKNENMRMRGYASGYLHPCAVHLAFLLGARGNTRAVYRTAFRRARTLRRFRQTSNIKLRHSTGLRPGLRSLPAIRGAGTSGWSCGDRGGSLRPGAPKSGAALATALAISLRGETGRLSG